MISKDNLLDLMEHESLWNLFLVSLFSADTLQTKEDCLRSLEIVGEIERIIPDIQDEDKRKALIDWMEKIKNIVSRDLEGMA